MPSAHTCVLSDSGGPTVSFVQPGAGTALNVLGVVGGRAEVVYSSLGVELGVEGSAGANVQLLPADAAGNVLLRVNLTDPAAHLRAVQGANPNLVEIRVAR